MRETIIFFLIFEKRFDFFFLGLPSCDVTSHSEGIWLLFGKGNRPFQKFLFLILGECEVVACTLHDNKPNNQNSVRFRISTRCEQWFYQHCWVFH